MIGRKERLKPDHRVKIDGEVGESSDGSFHFSVHGIEVAQNQHLQKTDFHPHEASVMYGRAVSNLDLGKETSAEL